MNRQTKLKLVEKLNNEFEDLLTKKQKANYGSYMRAINEEVIDKVPKTKKEIASIVKKYQVDTKVSAQMFTVLSGVENYLLNDPTRKSRELLKPLEPIMRAYSVKSPKTFAQGIYDMTAGRNTSERSKQFKPALLSYYDGFTENIESLDKQNQRALQRTEVEKASQVFKDLEDLREARVPIREAKQILIDRYNDPKRVTTALNTELHEQAERTKLEQSKFMGYTHKRWNTQGDERVRRTNFHNSVKGKIIPVDSAFKGGGQSAEYPGDVTLEVGERINCRCFITYHNSPDAKISTRTVIAPPKRPTVSAPVIIPPTRPPSIRAAEQRYQPQPSSGEALRQLKKEVKNVKIIGNISAKINLDVVKDTANSFGDLFKSNRMFDKYNVSIKTERRSIVGAIAGYRNGGSIDFDDKKQVTPEIVFYQDSVNIDTDTIIRKIKRNGELNESMKVDEGKETAYYAEHEMGHFVQMKVLTENHYIRKVDEGIKLFEEYKELKARRESINAKYDKKLKDLQESAKKENKTLFDSGFNQEFRKIRDGQGKELKGFIDRYYEMDDIIIDSSARYYKNESVKLVKTDQEQEEVIKNNTSFYGLSNDKEFFAEHFAAYRLNSNPNPLTKAFGQVVEGALNDTIE